MTQVSEGALALLKRKCSHGGPPIIHTAEVQKLECELLDAGLMESPGVVTTKGYDVFREMIREPARVTWS